MKRRVQTYIVPALWWLFGLTAGAAAVWTVTEVVGIVSNYNMTSFPWWAPFAFAGIYFGPLLLLELGAALSCTLWARHRSRESQKKV